LPQAAFVPGTTISSAAMNSDLSDIANALTNSVAADGQTPLTGGIKFGNGSIGSPSISFTADPTTGVYFPGSKQWGVSVSGTAAFTVNTNNAGTGQNGSIVSQLNGAVLAPVGIVQDFAGSAAPAGWFLCYGQAISRTGYPELFQVIGTTFGTGDGSTTFNLPDARGRVTAGVDNMGGTPANHLSSAALGNTGGVDNAAVPILQANLPNVNLSTSSIVVNDPTHFHSITGSNQLGGTGGPTGTTVNAAGAATGNTNAAGTGISLSGSVPLGGSGTPISTLQPTIIFNKIIFAGRV